MTVGNVSYCLLQGVPLYPDQHTVAKPVFLPSRRRRKLAFLEWPLRSDLTDKTLTLTQSCMIRNEVDQCSDETPLERLIANGVSSVSPFSELRRAKVSVRDGRKMHGGSSAYASIHLKNHLTPAYFLKLVVLKEKWSAASHNTRSQPWISYRKRGRKLSLGKSKSTRECNGPSCRTTRLCFCTLSNFVRLFWSVEFGSRARWQQKQRARTAGEPNPFPVCVAIGP